MSRSESTRFTARTDAVSTVEVGTITGDIELESVAGKDRVEHRVRYAGAREWYRLEGADESPVAGADALRERHEQVVSSRRAPKGEPAGAADPPPGSGVGRDAEDPAAGSFGGARRG